MSDPGTIPNQAQRLRSGAAARLNDAAQCSDPAQRDELVTEALSMLAQARALRKQAERGIQPTDEQDARTAPTTTGMQ